MEGSPYQVPVEPEKSGYSGFAPLEAMEPIFRRRWWVRFLGIVLIVVGGVYTLTIFGALFGIPVLMCGVFLFQAGKHFDAAYAGDYYRIREGFEKLTLAIIVAAILFSILAVFMILYVMLIVSMIGLTIFGSSF
jgi:hypothetical protein